MNGSNSEQRVRAIQSLARERLDVLVIGGGIVGSGVARDAALRGLRTGLIDRYDFAFGTSSRSSRLLHGGIRYLAQGRLGLVRQASVEKDILHRIAPHLAQPLPFLFPAFRGTDWPFWQLRIGVKFYDFLSHPRGGGGSGALDRNQVLALLPGLREEGLAGAVTYSDSLTNDARLVLDTLRSAEMAGAIPANYVKFDRAERLPGSFLCHVTDQRTGRSFKIQARSVVNATGPWSEAIPPSGVRLRLTKGIHLVFHRDRLPVSRAVVITEGARILFVIPWGERVIVGTTDTDYDAAPEAVHTQPEDARYLLRAIHRFFPNVALTEQDVVSSWAGLRPLLSDPNGRPSDISRSHRIENPHPGWWDAAGGKLTTYRLMAEQTMDRVARFLGGNIGPCRTADQPLLPLEAVRGVSQITPPEFRRAVVEHYCASEWAVHLDDVMMRRSSWHFYHPHAGELGRRTAVWMSEILGWNAARQTEELQRYARLSDWPPVATANTDQILQPAA
ncbi:MAG: glycerol-3-phosphate dehydrogenase/oxidase [Verrucomicrobiota bacterium]